MPKGKEKKSDAPRFTPEEEAYFEETAREIRKKLKPSIDEIRKSERITGKDLATRIGPCRD